MGKRKMKEDLNPSHQVGDVSDSSEDDSSQVSQEIVNVDFEFFDPKEGDFHGVKSLLRSYLDDVTWNTTEFVELILAQTTVGTVIKTEEDESPIGFATVLNLERYKSHDCMQEIRTFLLEKCGRECEAGQLQALWQKQEKVGLIVSERLINVPVDLAPPLYEGLFQEVAWATEDEPVQSLRDAFKFSDYLILTRVYQEISEKKGLSKSKKKKTKQNLKDLPQETGSLIYVKPEDEIFHKLSSWSYTFQVNAETSAAHESQLERELVIRVADIILKALLYLECSLYVAVTIGEGACNQSG